MLERGLRRRSGSPKKDQEVRKGIRESGRELGWLQKDNGVRKRIRILERGI